jgi:hypothetical protein
MATGSALDSAPSRKPAAASMAPRAMPSTPSSTRETISSICRRYCTKDSMALYTATSVLITGMMPVTSSRFISQRVARPITASLTQPMTPLMSVSHRMPSWLCISSHSPAGPCSTRMVMKRHTPVATLSMVRSRATTVGPRRCDNFSKMRSTLMPSTSSTKPRTERSEKSAGGVSPASRTWPNSQPLMSLIRCVRMLPKKRPKPARTAPSRLMRKPTGLVRMSPTAEAALQRGPGREQGLWRHGGHLRGAAGELARLGAGPMRHHPAC